MNQLFVAPTRFFKLIWRFISCLFSTLCHRDPISLYTLVINEILNIPWDELLMCKWLNFDPSNVTYFVQGQRKRLPHGYKKKDTWNLWRDCIRSAFAAKISIISRLLQRSQQRGFAMRFSSEWIEDTLTLGNTIDMHDVGHCLWVGQSTNAWVLSAPLKRSLYSLEMGFLCSRGAWRQCLAGAVANATSLWCNHNAQFGDPQNHHWKKNLWIELSQM